MSDTEQDIAPAVATVPETPAAPVEAVSEDVVAAPAETPVEAIVAEPPTVPVKAKRGRKPKVVGEAAELAKPAAPVKAPVKAKAKPGPKPKAKPAPAARKAATRPVINEKKPAKLPITKLTVKRAVAQPAPKKETIKMATKTKTTTDFTAKIQDTFKESAEKAKAVFGDAGEFAKGNVEAVVASTKILATGVKSMGEAYVAETKSAYETMTADLKELAAVKSPTEFFELQSKLLRKNFDAAVATGSKKSEEVLKLANEAFQPISTRLSMAMEKIKQAA